MVCAWEKVAEITEEALDEIQPDATVTPFTRGDKRSLLREIAEARAAGAPEDYIQAIIDDYNRGPQSGTIFPGAQHGALVLPRSGGTRVNVGEAGRAEAIIPLPDLAALASNLMAGVGGGSRLGGGMGSGAGGGREVVLALDGERLGSVFLDQFNILQSENRLLVDLV